MSYAPESGGKTHNAKLRFIGLANKQKVLGSSKLKHIRTFLPN